ncbi:uncharacterized protein RHO25_012303 [Cercospora beticola]|uniref:ABC transmembrane type-1 domain-containing protein n=1 Tax=Cercospora beticola TaxID=122368 RepID=A0ABZ0P6X2_CERBT|nr:hypothetical protein RHO25_012303 [Cercospora beticola]CAK1356555.1 unnamed protein product [Cercospora beticola]
MRPICRNDAAWGPFVRGCRHDCDFIVTFEHVIVPVPLSLLAVVLLCCRARQLWHRPRIVTLGWPHACKRCAYLLLAACHVGALAVCATLDTPESHAYIASGSLASLVALLLIPIAHLEARCSLRPPVVMQTYLVLDASWRAVQVRTSWLVASSSTFTLYAALSSAIVLVDLIALLLECLPHRVATLTLPRSPEEGAGLFSLASFAWLLPLLRTGYVKPLLLSDLDASASPPRINLVRARTSIHSLRSLGAPLLLPLLATVLPRALLAVFSFAQVFLLNAILQHLRGPADADTRKVGWALVGATFLVYAGSETATTWYWYSHERVLSLGRSILIEALYTHTLTRTVEMVSEAEGLTLMGTEVERVRVGFAGLHDLWCCPLEAAFALWMLYRRLGLAAAAPLVLVCFVTACIGLLGRVIPRHQRAWIHARQRRTMLTANLVIDIESLQTTQLADAAEACVQLLREHEIDIGQRYRLLQLLIVTLAFVPTHLSPALTFAFTGSDLTVSTMFQSVALMMLIATPLAQLFQRAPPFLAACACLGRMQGYLRAEQKTDLRHFERYPSDSLASCAAITIAGLTSDGEMQLQYCTISMRAFHGDA